ncbi:MAG: hypothetical protein LBP34_05900, partial [Flavobacteriaceae bacterium]|nr:hypothetical protein [Flavobacteriaceae bacterium]
MRILSNINSYKLRNGFIQIDEERDFRLDSKYIKMNYIEDKIIEKRTFKNNFHFTNNTNYLLFGTDNQIYKIDEDNYIGLQSYKIEKEYCIVIDDKKLCNLYDLVRKRNALKNWLPKRLLHIQDQYWINDTEDDLKLIDAETGEILWTIKQPEVEKPYGYNGLTNVKKVLGIYDQNLWLQLPDSRVW